MADVVIFGVKDLASLAHFYLKNDSEHRVIGFTVDKEHMPEEPAFEELPVFEFDSLESSVDSKRVLGFAPISSARMNKGREAVYTRFKEKGFKLVSYVSSRATVFEGTQIGDNCFILEDNTIQPFVKIGDDVILWSGNHIGHHSVVGDHVFISSHVVVSGHCHIGNNVFLGVNATIRDQLTIGDGTFVGMAASISKNTDPWSVHSGESAKVAKFSSDRLG